VDGAYELAIDVTCMAPSSGVITGSSSFQSAAVSGLIDRSTPFVVSETPVNGTGAYRYKDDISLVFNERINCELPYTFAAELKLPHRTLKGSDLSSSCQHDRLVIYILASSGVTVCARKTTIRHKKLVILFSDDVSLSFYSS
jgi:hypothetical protein